MVSKLEEYINGIPPTVFNQTTLMDFFWNLRGKHLIPYELDFDNFIIAATMNNKIEKIKIKYVGKANSKRKEFIRYTCNSPSPFSIGLSLRSKSYLSHNSALYIHGLIAKAPKEMCINKEQSPKEYWNDSTLTQVGIDRAFKNKARQSQYIWKWKRHKFVLLNGKNTGDYGVINITLDDGENLRTTDIERTLVDIVVRPIYFGGVNKVIEIYSRAKVRVSIEKIIQTLKSLNHAYPYHQSIGFLMERSGYEKHKLDKLRNLSVEYDFYLDYNMEDVEYDSNWKLYYPKDLLR